MPDKREQAMIARHEANRGHICGNCRRWAWDSFEGEENRAPCIWPKIFTDPGPDDKDVPMPPWVELMPLITPCTHGRNCPVFLAIEPMEGL